MSIPNDNNYEKEMYSLPLGPTGRYDFVSRYWTVTEIRMNDNNIATTAETN